MLQSSVTRFPCATCPISWPKRPAHSACSGGGRPRHSLSSGAISARAAACGGSSCTAGSSKARQYSPPPWQPAAQAQVLVLDSACSSWRVSMPQGSYGWKTSTCSSSPSRCESSCTAVAASTRSQKHRLSSPSYASTSAAAACPATRLSTERLLSSTLRLRKCASAPRSPSMGSRHFTRGEIIATSANSALSFGTARRRFSMASRQAHIRRKSSVCGSGPGGWFTRGAASQASRYSTSFTAKAAGSERGDVGISLNTRTKTPPTTNSLRSLSYTKVRQKPASSASLDWMASMSRSKSSSSGTPGSGRAPA
mmetsp:Transcript_28963/g.80996  ORF Transcript_28963/g.80996 Transcript_28963/m.80996 type:complete len:310 (-) Transcript_28963:3533-4462(-)